MKKIIKSLGKPIKEIKESQPETGQPFGLRPQDRRPLAEKVEIISKVETVGQEVKSLRDVRTKRPCLFCQNKSRPAYTDLVTLRRFLTDRAKIVAKERSGVCARHQRAVAKNIKYARHLSLLPFVPKV